MCLGFQAVLKYRVCLSHRLVYYPFPRVRVYLRPFHDGSRPEGTGAPLRTDEETVHLPVLNLNQYLWRIEGSILTYSRICSSQFPTTHCGPLLPHNYSFLPRISCVHHGRYSSFTHCFKRRNAARIWYTPR